MHRWAYSLQFEHDCLFPAVSWIISTDWLPAELQYVHLHSVHLREVWKPDRLPRELRYFYLNACYGPKMGATSGYSKAIDFERLPSKIEELILIGSNAGNAININALPNTMRLLYIRAYPEYVDSISIDYSALPQSLLHLHVTPMRGANNFNRIVQISGEPRGVKLVTQHDNTMPYRTSLHMGNFTKFRL